MIVKFGKMEWVVIGDYGEQRFWVAAFIFLNCVVVQGCIHFVINHWVVELWSLVFWCVYYTSINTFEYPFANKTNSIDYKILKS